MRPVILESPYSGEVRRNEAYARAAMADSLRRGEAPMASHLLYTQVLDDRDPYQRGVGIDAGFAWSKHAEATVVYTDLGISTGMRLGILHAARDGRPVEERSLPHWSWPAELGVEPAAAPAPVDGMVGDLLLHAMKLAERWQACVDAPDLRHTLTQIAERVAPLVPDVPDEELRDQLACCREDWQRVCDALGEAGHHLDPDDVVRAIGVLRDVARSAVAVDHGKRRLRIGQALTAALTDPAAAPAPDWNDADEVDRLVDAVLQAWPG